MSWWDNAGEDDETAAIDHMEVALSPLPEDTGRVRVLISRLEACHHKA